MSEYECCSLELGTFLATALLYIGKRCKMDILKAEIELKRKLLQETSVVVGAVLCYGDFGKKNICIVLNNNIPLYVYFYIEWRQKIFQAWGFANE